MELSLLSLLIMIQVMLIIILEEGLALGIIMIYKYLQIILILIAFPLFLAIIKIIQEKENLFLLGILIMIIPILG